MINFQLHPMLQDLRPDEWDIRFFQNNGRSSYVCKKQNIEAFFRADMVWNKRITYQYTNLEYPPTMDLFLMQRRGFQSKRVLQKLLSNDPLTFDQKDADKVKKWILQSINETMGPLAKIREAYLALHYGKQLFGKPCAPITYICTHTKKVIGADYPLHEDHHAWMNNLKKFCGKNIQHLHTIPLLIPQSAHETIRQTQACEMLLEQLKIHADHPVVKIT